MHRVDAGGCRRWMQGVDAGGGCRGWMQGVYRWTPQAGCELPTTPGPGSGGERPGGHFRQNAPRAGGAPKRISGVRTARGRRLGPQVAVSGGGGGGGGGAGGGAGEGGRGKEEEGGGTVKKQNLHTW